MHPKPSELKITLGRVAIIATIAAWFVYLVSTILRQFLDNGPQNFQFTMQAASYLIVVTFLTFSALMYLVARQGAFHRFRDHVRTPREELDNHFVGNQGNLTVLVPSYAEEPDVVRATLWSAALQEYPAIRVVLLLDDPPYPTNPDVAARLDHTRRLAGEIQSALEYPASRFTAAMLSAELEAQESALRQGTLRAVADEYEWGALWLEDFARREKRDDHVDIFFIEQVLLGLATDLRAVSVALATAADEGAQPSDERLLEFYHRLVSIFTAEMSTFERKKYASLSHEANKAMNLNAYIGLMGANYSEERTPDGTILVPADGFGDLAVPDSDYVLTLDADSLLLREYCLRLVHFLERPENARVAVVQTPYSAFRGAPTRIERLAGATTDLQHILHQGKTFHNATFWVGANAVIRKRALEDIMEEETVNGFVVRRYVQDRTVIEDTESSIDIAAHGWQLVNYPERLSYSATPPDFGSLVVQRRRWANGGLLIMPKLWRQVRDNRARGQQINRMELLLRINYMSSIAWASFGLLFLLAYPYDSRLLSPVVLIAAVPYFLCMGSDLRYCGYRFRDILWIYGFNLILLPVNLAGVLKSIQQALTNRKIPFARTPKVRNRTSAPLIYVLAPYVIVAFSVLTFWRDYHAGNWGNATFAAINATLASAAIIAYVGLRSSIVDIWIGVTKWLYVPIKPSASASSPTDSADALDWQSVLYGKQKQPVVAPERRPAPAETRARSNAVAQDPVKVSR